MSKSLQKEERRRKIFGVAGQLFFQLGYDGTTMSAIASALGGSKETLWRYFSNKEVLFKAYIDFETESFRSRLAPYLTFEASLENSLTNFARRYIEEICSPEAIGLHRLAVSESARFPTIGHLFYERATKATEELLAHFLEEQMNAGSLRSADPIRAARILIQLCMLHRYPVIFGVQTAAEINAETLARINVSDFMNFYQPV